MVGGEAEGGSVMATDPPAWSCPICSSGTYATRFVDLMMLVCQCDGCTVWFASPEKFNGRMAVKPLQVRQEPVEDREKR